MIVKWWSNECRQLKQVSLLASGLLPQRETLLLKAHLQTCSQCQQYHNELMELKGEVSRLKDSVSQTVPSAGFHARWTKQVAETSRSAQDGFRNTRTLDLVHQWFSLPRMALAGGFAVAICVAIVFALSHGRTQTNKITASPLLQNPELIRETLAMFPGRVRAITQDERGLNLVLSDKPNVPASTPLYVRVCDRKHCQSFVTFSGQEIRVAGQMVSVLSDPQGKMILMGEDFIWSNKDQVHSDARLEIEAKNLGSIPM